MLGHSSIAGEPIAAGASGATSVGSILPAQVGSFVFTGQAASFHVNYTMPMAAGSFVLTGQDTVGTVMFTMEADSGSFAISGLMRFSRETSAHRKVTKVGFRFELDDTITAGGV